MNFTQIGELLHITRQGARQLILRNQKTLKKSLIIKNNKIIGINDNDIDLLYNLQERRPNTDLRKSNKITILENQITSLENQIKLFEKLLNEKDKNIDILSNQIASLNAQLSHYQNLSFFERLIGYKK